MSKSICALAFVLIVVCTPFAVATIAEAPLANAIHQAVQDAVQKVLQGVNAYGNQVENKVNQVQQTVTSIAQPFVTTTGSVAQQLVNDYRTMGQTLGQQWLASMSNAGSQFGVLGDQIGLFLEAYESEFCTPAEFTPSVKKPAKFYGPAFELALDSGYCFLNETLLLQNKTKELECVEPSIIFSKTPANFTSKYKSAPKFVSKQCAIEKTFGTEVRKVLYVFDGTNPVDVNSLTTTVLSEVRSLMDGLLGPAHTQLATQLQKFMATVGALHPTTTLFPQLNMNAIEASLASAGAGTTA